MANYLYGSSNVYRHFSRCCGAGVFAGRDLQLVKCTKKTVLDAHLLTVESAGLVITSVLANFIVKICSGVTEEEVPLFANQQITAHVDSLLSLVNRIPSVNVIIVPPLFRSSPSWFGPYLPGIVNYLVSEVGRAGSDRIAVCQPFICTPGLLEEDGLHLTVQGGDRFLQHIDSELGRLLVEVIPAVAPDRLDQILAAVTRNSAQLDNFGVLSDTVRGLTQSTSEFEAHVRRRFKDDDLIFARMKEESDAETNRSREDRVVITGLPGPASAVSTHADKKKHYIEVLNGLILIACAASVQMPKL
jgi:hypothetical protein